MLLLLQSYGALIIVRLALSKPMHNISRCNYEYMNPMEIKSFYQNPCSIVGIHALSKLAYEGNRSSYGYMHSRTIKIIYLKPLYYLWIHAFHNNRYPLSKATIKSMNQIGTCIYELYVENPYVNELYLEKPYINELDLGNPCIDKVDLANTCICELHLGNPSSKCFYQQIRSIKPLDGKIDICVPQQ